MKNHTGVNWDLRSYFPEFNGSKMRGFMSDLEQDIDELKNTSGKLTDLNTENSDDWDSLFVNLEEVYSRLGHLSSYLSCLEAADVENEGYAMGRAALIRLQADVEKIDIDILKVLKKLPTYRFESFIERPRMKNIEYQLRRWRKRSKYSMTAKEETLASDLKIDGMTAWGRLYDKISGKLAFVLVTQDGRTRQVPISQWRSLMSNPDRDIGRAAFEGGNHAWKSVEDTCGAALNAIVGSRLTLCRHRGMKHFMDQALFGAATSSETLEAMYKAVYRHIDTARDILRNKARFFGRTGIWFFEREAPLPLKQSQKYSWSEAVDMVRRAFALSYPALADYFEDMLKKRWIESESRPGKRPGAFCTGSSLIDEQRVYMTFNGTLGDILTLAHEVGHAWHGHLLRGTRPFARRYPMPLAETASIFAEHLLVEGLYKGEGLDHQQKLGLLDTELTDAAVFLLDITTRYEFEKAFYEERQEGEVSVSRLKSLMTETQRKIYGDTLLADGEDPYFWASKLHFFITDTSFYNFPYTFGFLLARAIIYTYRLVGAEFIPQYESFLRMSGSGTVEEVGRRSLNIDFTKPRFWEQAILSLHEPMENYRQEITRAVSGT